MTKKKGYPAMDTPDRKVLRGKSISLPEFEINKFYENNLYPNVSRSGRPISASNSLLVVACVGGQNRTMGYRGDVRRARRVHLSSSRPNAIRAHPQIGFCRACCIRLDFSSSRSARNNHHIRSISVYILDANKLRKYHTYNYSSHIYRQSARFAG